MKHTKEAILDATINFLENENIYEFSIDKIARLIGIRKASIFHHFATKELLLTSAVKKRQQMLNASDFNELISGQIKNTKKFIYLYEYFNNMKSL